MRPVQPPTLQSLTLTASLAGSLALSHAAWHSVKLAHLSLASSASHRVVWQSHSYNVGRTVRHSYCYVVCVSRSSPVRSMWRCSGRDDLGAEGFMWRHVASATRTSSPNGSAGLRSSTALASDVIVLASRHQNNQAIINTERIHGSELQAPQLLPMNPCAAAAPLQVKLTSLNRHELSCPVLAHPAVLSSA